MIVLALLGCHRHAMEPPTWPGPDGRSCEGQHTLMVDPAPWGEVEAVSVGIGRTAASGKPGEALAVASHRDLEQVELELAGNQGPASCMVDLRRGISHLDCGPYAIVAHAPSLCDSLLITERMERVARPEVANFVVARKFGVKREAEDVRGLWNKQDPRGLGERIERCAGSKVGECEDLEAIRHAMQHGLERLDGLDRFDDPKGKKRSTEMGAGLDWCTAVPGPEGPACEGRHPLFSLLVEDGLLVDTSKRCTVNSVSFLEIELAHLQVRPLVEGSRHQTCGGRPPGDDAVDTLLTVTLNGLRRVPPGAPFYGPQDAEPDPRRGDEVNRASAEPSPTFPWLADP